MIFRIVTLLFAALVVLLPATGIAQDGVKADPFDKWREREPEKTSDAPAMLNIPPSATDSVVSPVTLPPATPQDKPRTEKPLEDYTEYFSRNEIGVGSDKERHRLTYYLKQPKTAPGPQKKYPLVLVLHDGKGVAHAAQHLILKDTPRSFPAFIAVPVLPQGKIWSFPDEFPDEPALGGNLRLKQGLSDAVDLVAALAEEHPIDRRRVYVIGCGDGGFGAFGAARRFKDIFAAAVPINGGWALKESTKMTDVPLWVMHGEQNKAVPSRLSQNVAYYVQKFGGKVWYLEVPDLDQDCSDRRLYTKTLWDWMFKQRK